MLRLRKKPDTYLIQQIRQNKPEVLIELFERNYLDARLLLEPSGASDQQINTIVQDSLTILWCYLNSSKSSTISDGLDQLLNYCVGVLANRRLTNVQLPKESIPEVDVYINEHEKETALSADNNLVSRYKPLLKEREMQILQLNYLEGFSLDSVKQSVGVGQGTDLDKMRLQALMKLFRLIKAGNNSSQIAQKMDDD